MEIRNDLDGRVVFLVDGKITVAMSYEAVPFLPRVGEVCTFQTMAGDPGPVVETSGIVRRVEHVNQTNVGLPLSGYTAVVITLEKVGDN